MFAVVSADRLKWATCPESDESDGTPCDGYCLPKVLISLRSGSSLTFLHSKPVILNADPEDTVVSRQDPDRVLRIAGLVFLAQRVDGTHSRGQSNKAGPANIK